MVVVIDVGNTSTSFGLYARKRVGKTDRIDTALTSVRRLVPRLRALAGRKPVAGVVYSSVVPSVDAEWKKSARAVWPEARWLAVNHTLNLGVKITYPKPETIGADRLANACGAAEKYGTPVIVADFGTAVTFDVIGANDGYIGGIIAPGLPLMFSYLAEKTALLPRIKPGRARHGVGKSTEEAMRLGALWGYRGLVREILCELTLRMKEGRVHLCATGGFAGWVLKGAGLSMNIDPELTLYGLGRIHDLNP